MDTKVFDCAIIGGGLAGLTLSIQLANAGHSVVLFEKEKYPFHKVCGEYISMESYSFLERLGMPLSQMELPMINEVSISSPNGNMLTRKLGLGGFGISRYTLDSALAKIVTAKGVMVLEETKVMDVAFDENIFSINTGKETYSAKVACGTYGKKSSLDRLLARPSMNGHSEKKKNYLAVKYHITIGPPANRIELHNFKNGYCGISKVDGDKYCLCYLTDSENLKENSNSIKQMERNVLMQNPFLKKYFSEAIFLNEQPYTISQLTFDKKSCVEKHMLMLGDSAATIAPLCGNGMSMAMHASFMLSPLIQKYVQGIISREQLELDYTQQWDKLFATRVKAGKYLQGFFGKETLTNTTIGLLKHTPIITDKLIQMTHGQIF